MDLTITTLGVLVIGSIGLIYLLQLAYDRDPERAAERTAERSLGIVTGAGASVGAALVVGLDWLLSMPELLLTVTGVGAILSGTEWEIYLAMAVVVWILSMLVERRSTRGA